MSTTCPCFHAVPSRSLVQPVNAGAHLLEPRRVVLREAPLLQVQPLRQHCILLLQQHEPQRLEVVKALQTKLVRRPRPACTASLTLRQPAAAPRLRTAGTCTHQPWVGLRAGRTHPCHAEAPTSPAQTPWSHSVATSLPFPRHSAHVRVVCAAVNTCGAGPRQINIPLSRNIKSKHESPCFARSVCPRFLPIFGERKRNP